MTEELDRQRAVEPRSEEQLRMQIAENIAYYRKQNGDTQAELAEKLNYSDKSVSKWERGDGTPDIYILAKIAALYKITVQDLLREKKVPKASIRRILIYLLSIGLAWLVMTVVFCLSQITGVLEHSSWLLFIYAIPISGIISVVYCAMWWNHLLQALSSSLIVWGVGLSIVLSIPFRSILFLLIICAVLQILLILYFILIHQSHSNAK